MAQNWIKEGNVPRVMIPTAMFPGLVLGLPAARVYAALAIRANNASGLVDSTLEQIAADAGLSVSQVKVGLKLLLDNGWLTKVRQGNSRVSNKYKIHASPVAVNQPETKPVDQPEIRPVKEPETKPVQDADEGSNQPETQPETQPEPAGNPAQTSRKSGHPLVSPPSCLPKDLSTGGTTYLPADAEASRSSEDVVIDAEIVDESPQAEELFAVDEQPPAKATKKPRKARTPKSVDPAVKVRQEQAAHLAKSYYDAMAGMVKFVGVQQIITSALSRFPYEAVRDGVKHLALVDRHRPFTRQTLLNAIEGHAGGPPAPGRPVGLPQLSTGDLRLVQGEWLKSTPNWDLLAQLGVTPENASHYGWRKPA